MMCQSPLTDKDHSMGSREEIIRITSVKKLAGTD